MRAPSCSLPPPRVGAFSNTMLEAAMGRAGRDDAETRLSMQAMVERYIQPRAQASADARRR